MQQQNTEMSKPKCTDCNGAAAVLPEFDDDDDLGNIPFWRYCACNRGFYSGMTAHLTSRVDYIMIKQLRWHKSLGINTPDFNNPEIENYLAAEIK